MAHSRSENINKIKISIEEALNNKANPIAAFDADGTLWPTDMGEIFFKHQLKNNQIKNLPNNPWEYYQKMRSEQPKKAYLWLAQINQGHKISEVRQWALHAINEAKNFFIFDEQKEIIDFLHKKNVSVYVVTASLKWAVEPAAQKFNIPNENVVGIETKIIDEMVTDLQAGPITYREGKVEALLMKTQGKHPFFVSGNTMGDFKLLECSSHLRLSITSAPVDHVNYETEQKIAKISAENNWFNFNYLD